MAQRAGPHASPWGWSLALAALLAVAFAASADTAVPSSRVPRPVVDAGQGDKCVENTDFMRRNHMRLLQHQRDETVHEGIRPHDTSLERCIACHASRISGSVVGSDQNFCQGCHAYAAVKLDCFECHSSKSQVGGAAANRGNLVGATQ
jgi:hypothetical protein